MALKLSDLNPKDIQVINKPLKLSELNHEEITPIKFNAEEASNAPNLDEYLKQSGINVLKQPEQISAGQSALMGAGQGASLGLADELSALSGTAGAMSGGDTRSLGDIYRDVRSQTRQNFNEAQKQNPGSFLAGQLGGGVLSAGLLGSLGTVSQPEATFGQRIINAAKIGGGAGAALGLGESEADLTKGEVGKTALDVTKGALGGAAIGGAGQTLGEGLKGIGSLLKQGINEAADIPIINDIKNSYKYGKQGEKLTGKSARRQIGEDITDYADEVADDLEGKQKELGQAKGSIIQQAQEKAQKLDTNNVLLNSLKKVSSLPEDTNQQVKDKNEIVQFLLKKIKSPEEEDLSVSDLIKSLTEQPRESLELAPEALDQFKQSASELTNVGQEPLATPKARAVATDLTSGLNNILTNPENGVPGLGEANQKYASLSKAMEMLKLRNSMGNKEDLAQSKALSPIFQRLENESVSGDLARKTFSEAIDQIKTADPELANKIQKQGTDLATKYDLIRKMTQEGFGRHGLMGTAKGKALSGANIIGRSINKITGYTPEQLTNLSQNISTMGDTGAKLSKILSEAANKDQIGRNALLFTIQQNPTYRQFLDNLGGEETSGQ